MTAMNPTIGQYLKYEAGQNYSRDNVTVASGQNLRCGQVVARITASGKITAFNPAGADGSQTPVGVMAMDVDATSGDQPGVIIARHAIVVDRDNLYWPASPATTNAQRDAALDTLKTLGILARATA